MVNTTLCRVKNFVSGSIAYHVMDWRCITSDPSILEIVSGYLTDFARLPYQSFVPNVKYSKGDAYIIETEVMKLLDKGVVTETTHSKGKFISSLYQA